MIETEDEPLSGPLLDDRAVLTHFTPLDLPFLLKQEADFHQCRPARGRICPVCQQHARYCGHTRDEMIAALLPRQQPTGQTVL